MKNAFILLAFSLITQGVFCQQTVLGMSKLNVAYYGVDNPFIVMVENISCDSILLKVRNGSITRAKARCSYSFKPERPGNAIILVYKINNNDTIKIAQHELRIKMLPLTIYSDSHHILKDQILDLHNRVYICALNTGISLKIPAESYRILLRKNGEIIFDKVYNPLDDQSELEEMLSLLDVGDEILIIEPKYIWDDHLCKANGTLNLLVM